jgi:hypothetical protein
VVGGKNCAGAVKWIQVKKKIACAVAMIFMSTGINYPTLTDGVSGGIR